VILRKVLDYLTLVFDTKYWVLRNASKISF